MATITFKDYPDTTTPVTAEILNELQTNLMLTMNPIGSIVINVTNANPSTYIGGTWVAWGSGRVPIGVDVTQTEFDTVEKTGGAKTHTLTIPQLPKFRPEAKTNSTGGGDWGVLAMGAAGGTIKNNPFSEIGGNQPHNNLPPYITCYMFKRTA